MAATRSVSPMTFGCRQSFDPRTRLCGDRGDRNARYGRRGRRRQAARDERQPSSPWTSATRSRSPAISSSATMAGSRRSAQGRLRRAQRPTQTYDATGEIVMPGFLSGHSHLWQSAFRGIAADQWVTSWVQSIHRTYGPHFADGRSLHVHAARRSRLSAARHYYDVQLFAECRRLAGAIRGAIPGGARRRCTFHLRLRSVRAAVAPGGAARRSSPSSSRVEREPRTPLLLKVSIATGGGTGGRGYLEMVADLVRDSRSRRANAFSRGAKLAETNQESFDPLERAGLLGPSLVFAHFIHTNDAHRRAQRSRRRRHDLERAFQRPPCIGPCRHTFVHENGASRRHGARRSGERRHLRSVREHADGSLRPSHEV